MEIATFNEKDISAEFDQRIRKNLCICFPEDVSYFSHARGWKETLPATTIVGLDEYDDPIAHIGVIQRDIQVEGEKYHVFGFQNVYVVPSHRGKKLIDLLFDYLLASFKENEFDFGLLFCKPEVAHVYERMGWRKIVEVVVTLQNPSGEIVNRPFIHDDMFFFPLKVKIPPSGNYLFNGPDW